MDQLPQINGIDNADKAQMEDDVKESDEGNHE